MQVFNLTLTQMLNMFAIILAGYIIKKLKILPDNSDKVISRLGTYIFVPALAMGNQIKYCTTENFVNNFRLMLYSLLVIIIGLVLAYLLVGIFVKKSVTPNAYSRQIYKYALTFGNYGYVGNFLVLGIWGEEMLFKYLMFTFIPGLVCYAWGIYILIPKSENSPGVLANLKNGLLKPPFMGLVIGMILGITGLGKYLPSFLHTALSNAGNCMGPCGMLLAGVVIGSYKFGDLLKNKKVYLACLFRLVIIPALFSLILKAIGADKEIIVLSLVAFAAPLGLNTIVYPAAFGGETKTGASMAMISHALSVITIPVMYLIFVELL